MALSRRMALAAGLAVVTADPVAAQEENYGPANERQVSPAQAAIDASQYWTRRRPERPSECDEANPDPDIIVVCREWEEGEEYQIDSPVQADTEVTGSGAPRAPDVSFMKPCSSYTVCVGGLGSVPAPAIMVDFAELPETPPGSIAARLYDGPTAGDPVEGVSSNAP